MTKEKVVGEFVKCHSRLWAMAQAITRDYHLTEDVLQEVSLVLIKKRDQFDPSRSFVAWALGITRLQAFKILDKRAKKTSHLDEETLDILENLVAEQKSSYHEDRLVALRSCLSRMTQKNYQIMQMKYVQKLSARDLAEKIERTETATHSLLQRIRKQMQACISSRLMEGLDS